MAIELPTLYSKNATGRVIAWEVYSQGDIVVTAHGVLGGKMAENKTRVKPTNVGRANERNGAQQAEFEARAAWQKKIDEGYQETVGQAETVMIYLPMLAHPVRKKVRVKGELVEKRREIHYPCHCQRKLNGLRCLSTTKSLTSRQGTVWDIPHIAEHVAMFLDDNEILDGEVYAHGVPLQMLNSLIKVNRPESLVLRYHVYDFPRIENNEGLIWQERWMKLVERYTAYESACNAQQKEPIIKLVESFVVETEEQIKALEKIVIAEGYEGLILRRMDGNYHFNQRKDCLLKWKNFIDEEFEVLDMTSRTLIKDGTEVEICDVCICRNNLTDATFKVVPIGTEKDKEEYWKDRENRIGRRMLVRFMERSMDGIPQGNTVGVCFRLEEDLPIEEEEMWN